MATQVSVKQQEQENLVEESSPSNNQKAKQEAVAAKPEVLDQFEIHRRAFFGK